MIVEVSNMHVELYAEIWTFLKYHMHYHSARLFGLGFPRDNKRLKNQVAKL